MQRLYEEEAIVKTLLLKADQIIVLIVKQNRRRGMKNKQMSIEEMFDRAIRRVGLHPVVVNNASGQLVESIESSPSRKTRKPTRNGRKTKTLRQRG